LVTQTSNKPEKAFEATPAKRLGAILNVTTASLRDTLLSGLEEDGQTIGLSVRNAIFTFKDIPQRLNPTADITQCLRAVDKSVLAIALASAEQTELTAVSNFVLENMSKRLADNLRADIAESGEIKVAEGESAMAQVMLEIRRLIDLGEIKMITPSELEQDS
jgi:flagellar motor switch protein FliG